MIPRQPHRKTVTVMRERPTPSHLLTVLAIAASLPLLVGCGSGGSHQATRSHAAPMQSSPVQFDIATQYPLPSASLDAATTVAAVNGRGIPRAEFDHWLEVYARGQSPPVNIPSPGEPAYFAALGQVMGFLLGGAWSEQEAAWRHISVTAAESQAELTKERHTQFKTVAAWQHFLSTTGQTVADLELRIRLNLLSKKIQAEIVSGVRGSSAQQAALSEFATQFRAHLMPLTQCASGFVVQDCANYVPPTTGSAPATKSGVSPNPSTESTKTSQPTTPTTAAVTTPTSGPLSKQPTMIPPSDPAPTKLVTKDIITGTGAEAKAGDSVTVNYVGVLFNGGKQFDASWKRSETFTFTLGKGQVIPGWDQGVTGMKVGGRRELIIPAELAYGKRGSSPTIPANAALVFVVDMLGISPA
jgi:peptidylprolyl isomerase